MKVLFLFVKKTENFIVLFLSFHFKSDAHHKTITFVSIYIEFVEWIIHVSISLFIVFLRVFFFYIFFIAHYSPLSCVAFYFNFTKHLCSAFLFFSFASSHHRSLLSPLPSLQLLFNSLCEIVAPFFVFVCFGHEFR